MGVFDDFQVEVARREAEERDRQTRSSTPLTDEDRSIGITRRPDEGPIQGDPFAPGGAGLFTGEHTGTDPVITAGNVRIDRPALTNTVAERRASAQRGGLLAALQDNPFFKQASESDTFGSGLGGMQSAQTGLGDLAGDIRNQDTSLQEGLLRDQINNVDLLQPFATGQDSVVQQQADIARQRLAQDIASQMASARGGINPAAQRAALFAQSQGALGINAQAGPEAAAERQRAIGNLLDANAQTEEAARAQTNQGLIRGQTVGGILGKQGVIGQSQAQLPIDIFGGEQQSNIQRFANAIGG